MYFVVKNKFILTPKPKLQVQVQGKSIQLEYTYLCRKQKSRYIDDRQSKCFDIIVASQNISSSNIIFRNSKRDTLVYNVFWPSLKLNTFSRYLLSLEGYQIMYYVINCFYFFSFTNVYSIFSLYKAYLGQMFGRIS